MIVLGICDSHDAHACIVRDGKLEAVISEERLSRKKSDMSYPYKSIERVLSETNINTSDIDIVSISGESSDLFRSVYKINTVFSVRNWIDQCHKVWKPALIDGKGFDPIKDYNLYKHLRGDIESDLYYPIMSKLEKSPKNKWKEICINERRKVVSKHLNISEDKVVFFRHEDCHKAYGYYSSQDKYNNTLIFTLEGGGDDSSATVSIASNGIITEKWKSNDVMLGRLYRYVTLILGMLPIQHEYKVMGLAPYGTEYHGKHSLDFFHTIDSVKGTEIITNKNIKDLYFTVKDALEGDRFDGIAWGLQTYLEEILRDWVRNNINKYKISNIVISGGVAQNIKAVKTLINLPEVNSVWVGPISGDGSLGVGGAWLASRKFAPNVPISPFKSAYLGTKYDTSEINKAIKRADIKSKFNVIHNPTSDQIAKWISDGKIIARFSGRMEFGQRALGNRSILADPRRWDSVERINNKIKYRDFWMPFTPSMMIEESDRILVNPKCIYSPFMTMAFDIKQEFVDQLTAVIHPADKTVRPQMLKRELNPSYYDLLKSFKKITNIGVLLNTSFNLHGEAIVESPEDAISTFERSEIDILVFDHIAILRSKIS